MNKVISQTLRYATLPGIVPWLKGLGFNFGYLAYLMALVFNAVRLLPPPPPLSSGWQYGAVQRSAGSGGRGS